MKLVRKISFVILLFIALSCKQSSEVELETLANTYIDLLIVEDYYADNDSLEIKRQEVFEKYSVTEENFDSTFVSFKYDKEKWEKFFELAADRLDTLKLNIKRFKTPKE